LASIEQITPELTWPLRQVVMYPNWSIEEVQLANDFEGIHFGLFDNNVLISVVSTFIKEDSMQFRKFATLHSEQGKGYGSLLLSHIIQFAKDEGCGRMWCNARCNASAFYAKFGFTETERKFNQDGHDFVIMEIYL
jgi:GNAT superfamily N-acetyltransferase